MMKINLGEMNELALSIQATRYKEDMAEEMERAKQEKPVVSSNEVAKREIAAELLNQGFTEEAVCRILNLTEDQLPD
jgi:SOS response regulatory protein OraA/RecX